MRRIVAHEDKAVVVRGPLTGFAIDTRRSALQRAERRRLQVHREVSALCDQLHVRYVGREDSRAAARDRANYAGDLVHVSESAARARAEAEAEAMIAAWREAQAGR